MFIRIKGMGCMHCVAKIRKAMEEIGATVISCEIGACRIEPYPDKDRIRSAIENAGFGMIAIEE